MFFTRSLLVFSLLLAPLWLLGTPGAAQAQTPGIDEPVQVGPWDITLVDVSKVDEITSGNDNVYSPDDDNDFFLITKLHIQHRELDASPLVTMQTFDTKLLDDEGKVIATTIGFRLETYFCLKTEACHSISVADAENTDTEYVEYAYVVSPDEAESELTLEIDLGYPIEPNFTLDATGFDPAADASGIGEVITIADWEIQVTGINRTDEIEGVFQRTFSTEDDYDFLLVTLAFVNRDSTRATTMRHRDFYTVLRNSEGLGKRAIGAGSPTAKKYCLWTKGCTGTTSKDDSNTFDLEYVFVVQETWLQEPVELEAVLMVPTGPAIRFTLPFITGEGTAPQDSTTGPQATPTPTHTPTPAPVPTATPITCQLTARANVNLRSGPGTEYAVDAVLDAGTTVNATGQTTGVDGFVWWQLEEGLWVRTDVVVAMPGCSDLPTVTP